MTALCYFSVGGGNVLIGWIGVCFFGLGAVVFLLKLLFPNLKWLEGVKLPKEPDDKSFEKVYNDKGIFEYTEQGFNVLLTDGQKEIKWIEIKTMCAYKIDRYAFDTICLDVFCDNNKGFSINEEIPGWFQFVLASKKEFPQIDPTWEIKITYEAFETNFTLVYDRENRTVEEVQKTHYKD